MFQSTQFITTVECINQQKEVDISSFLPLAPIVVAVTLALEKQKADYVTIHFLSDRKMRRVHKTYYNDPSATDCMSFPIDIEEGDKTGVRILGDIFICPKVAEQVATEISTSLEHELCLYTIHATLHLLGYDDIKGTERKIMRQKEHDALQLLEHIQDHGTIY